ncbi:cation transporter dimerization domain-containing protein [Clostridium arbusti]|uniref:cation transporter dimerization domain-containing protein n=1 Tax=Clostridium arbusti TaxID=1137848 RepID=UPI00277D10B9|nr:cation transporter dimerization domain-containing protein [Clostridium arbusti]
MLVDSTAVDTGKIEKIAMAQKGIIWVHKVRSRGTIDDMHIDMHILADSKMNLEDSHRLTHKIEYAPRKELNNNVEVIVHIEP